jgi:hypothetical protein
MISLMVLILVPSSNTNFSIVNDTSEIRTVTESREINYEETYDEIINAECGLYSPVFYRFKPTGNVAPEYRDHFLHLRLDISVFCAQYNGEDIPLTEEALKCLDEILSNIEGQGHSAVIRFSYDGYFDGKEVKEPSLAIILMHQEQLGPILSKHKNAIATLETGMLGLWGELHGTEMCSKENLVTVVGKWLEVMPESVCVSVRTPLHYCWWKGIDRDDISYDVTNPGEVAYRVGIYNDGYFGSHSDLGTYANREEEVSWLYNQARHTLFGGELMAIQATEAGKTCSSQLEDEAFITHTSYLNVDYSPIAFDNLRNEIYNSKDSYYHGQTGYVYIRNHLGYRFVLRQVRMTSEVLLNDKLLIEATIDNVGFANMVKPKKLYVVLEGEEYNYTIPVTEHTPREGELIFNGDPLQWDTGKNKIWIFMNLPNGIKIGDYNAYLKIAYTKADIDTGYGDYPVRFANDDENIWNEDLGANFLGKIRVIKSRKVSDIIFVGNNIAQ